MKRLIILAAVVWAGCSGGNGKSDAYGNFESTEILISAESSGRLLFLHVSEGMSVDSGAIVGCVDTVQLHLKRSQLIASRQGVSSRVTNILAQIGVLREQKRVAETEKIRVETLFKENAATQKQLDDVSGQVSVLEKQIASIESQNAGVLAEVRSLDAQIDQINDQIRRSVIVNPVTGTVLTKYVEPFEILSYGKPLYKVADLETMYLRVYVSGGQLPSVKIGQTVEVLIDRDSKGMEPLHGEVSWVSSKAEFTPKIIQTKEERVNMVYAVKIRVVNDGRLKIGMPGEANFKP